MKKSKGFIAIIAAALVVSIIVVAGMSLTRNIGKSQTQIAEEDAVAKLQRMLNSGDITVHEPDPVKSPVDLLQETNLADELPTLDKDSASVYANAEITIEVFGSPEKCDTDGNDAFLTEVTRKFNKSGAEVNGKSIAVTTYNITSGLGLDYIVSGVKVPDMWSPSSEYWGRMAKAKGNSFELIDKSIAGNVAGMVIRNDKYDEIVDKYGVVNVQTVTKAVAEGMLLFGYTTPNTSSTGLDFVADSLYAYDSSNPLSQTAIDGFNSFQVNIPYVAQTTMQMKQAATNSGSLDGFVYESQVWENSKELHNGFKFVPFGIRHDNPVFIPEDISDEKREAIELYLDYIHSDESQAVADKKGFNTFSDYVPEYSDFDGGTLIEAQKMWKENKDSGRDILGVFVADVSLSMDGDPINSLKKSLTNGMQYISDNNLIGLVSYSTDVSIDCPIGKFDLEQKSKFKGAVENLYAGGNTATCNGLLVALNMVLEAQKDYPDARPIIFLLADGGLNKGYDLSDIRDILAALEIPVYTIGYNEEVPLLDKISEINEAATINATSDDVTYKIRNLFDSSM